jgi:hypothetical protein
MLVSSGCPIFKVFKSPVPNEQLNVFEILSVNAISMD